MTIDENAPGSSVRVVLYRRDATGETTLICSDSDDPAQSATVLIAPVSVPCTVVRALLATSVPAEFAENPHLNRHRALVFSDGRCRIGGHDLRYHEKFGVYPAEET
jgi:hypothetical protein